MHRILISVAVLALGAGAFSVAAGCSSTTSATGADGGAALGGGSCAWDEAASVDAGLLLVSGPPGGFPLGAVLETVDGCNGCGCTERGFECTHNVCRDRSDGAPACPTDTVTCPDGSRQRRLPGPCVFTLCPLEHGAGSACTAEAYQCPDGGPGRGRSGRFCTIPACP